MWNSVIVLFLLCVILCHSSFAIMLMGKRELVASLSLSSWCLVIDVALPCGVMGLFAVCDSGIPYYTRLLF